MPFKLKTFKRELSVSRIANVHYFEFTNRYHTRRDQHPFRELIYVDSKDIEVQAQYFTGPIGKNQLIIHRAMEPHALRCPENEAPNVIIIGFECKCEALDELSQQPVTLTAQQQHLLSEIVREGRSVFLPPYDQPDLKDMKKRPDFPFGADQALQLKLELLLLDLIRNRSPRPSAAPPPVSETKIQGLVEYLDQNYREELCLDELCFLFKTNKTTLCQQFKQLKQTTVIDYVNRLKIRDAKALLRQGEMNVTQIAQTVGFSSIHYFCRVFKKYTNLSPGEYARSIKSKLEQRPANFSKNG